MFLGTCAEKAADTSPLPSPTSYQVGGGFTLRDHGGQTKALK